MPGVCVCVREREREREREGRRERVGEMKSTTIYRFTNKTLKQLTTQARPANLEGLG